MCVQMARKLYMSILNWTSFSLQMMWSLSSLLLTVKARSCSVRISCRTTHNNIWSNTMQNYKIQLIFIPIVAACIHQLWLHAPLTAQPPVQTSCWNMFNTESVAAEKYILIMTHHKWHQQILLNFPHFSGLFSLLARHAYIGMACLPQQQEWNSTWGCKTSYIWHSRLHKYFYKFILAECWDVSDVKSVL